MLSFLDCRVQFFGFDVNRCCVVGLSFHMRVGLMILGFQAFVFMFQALWFWALNFYIGFRLRLRFVGFRS